VFAKRVNFACLDSEICLHVVVEDVYISKAAIML
jgi:hypothetical protein